MKSNNQITEQILQLFSKDDLAELLKLKTKLDDEKADSQKMSLRGFSLEYLEFIRETSSGKYASSHELSFKHARDFLGDDFKITKLDVKKAQELVNHFSKQAPKGISVYWRNWKAAFNKAIEWEYIEKNPFTKVKVKRILKKKVNYITVDDLEKIISNTENAQLKDIFSFSFYTGCRISETLSLTWDDIDIAKKSIIIGSDNFLTKSRRQRIVPICEAIDELLIRLKPVNAKEKNHIFCKSNGFPYSTEYISKAFKKICRKVGIDESISFHSLRHGCASYLVQNGVNLYAVKEILGHQSITTTEIYSHLNSDSLINAMSVFNKNNAA